MPQIGGMAQPVRLAQPAPAEPPAQPADNALTGTPAPEADAPNDASLAQPPDDFTQKIVDAFETRQAAGQIGQPDAGNGAKGTPPAEPPAQPAEEPEGEPPAEPPAAQTDPPAQPAEELPVEPPVEAPPAVSSGYTFQYHDGQQTQTQTVPDEEVKSALALAAWAQNLPEQTRGAMGAIESGQAVAIARADYDQFVAWKNQQQTQQRDADLQNYDDPEAAAEIKRLRDQVTQLGGQVPGQVPGVNGAANGQTNGQQIPAQQQAPQQQQPLQQQLSQQQAEINAIATQTQSAQDQYAAQHGMNAEQVQGLLQQAVDAEIIPYLMNRDTRINPVNGQVISAPDIGKVTREALDFARSRVVNGAGVNDTTNGTVPNAAPAAPSAPNAPPPPEDSVHSKKARAASLASAKGGATPPPPNQVRQLSEEDRIKAMANEIQASMAN